MEPAILPLPDAGRLVTSHPFLPVVFCGASYAFYRIDIVGIEYGPIIVTAIDLGDGLAARCPACFELLPLGEDTLGTETTCPTQGCSGRMRLNPFAINRPRRANNGGV
jgi:hypothetical protein